MNRAMRRDNTFRIRLLGGEWATQMTCQEAKCPQWADGWLSVIDPSTDTGAWQANWIKTASGRRFYEWRSQDALDEALALDGVDLTVTPELRAMLAGLAPGLIVFAFPPGQKCFREHLDREVKFLHGGYEHVRPLDWNEDWNIEGDKYNTAIRRG